MEGLVLWCFALLSSAVPDLDSVEVKVRYDPNILFVVGEATYTFKVPAGQEVSEVKFVSLSRIDRVSVGGKRVRFMRIPFPEIPQYRVYVVYLPETYDEGERFDVTLRFKVTGKWHKGMVYISRDGVFLRGNSLWLPVVLDLRKAVRINVSVECPENFSSVMGGEVLRVGSERDGFKTVRWSLFPVPMPDSATLIIGDFREKVFSDKVKVVIHTDVKDDVESYLIISAVKNSIDFYELKLGVKFPYREVHIVQWTGFPYQSAFAGEFIVGLIVIFDRISDRKYEVPFIPEYPIVGVNLIAHELAHAYFGGAVRFREDAKPMAEMLAESLSQKAVEFFTGESGETEKKFLERARVLLFNYRFSDRALSFYLMGPWIFKYVSFVKGEGSVWEIMRKLINYGSVKALSSHEISKEVKEIVGFDLLKVVSSEDEMGDIKVSKVSNFIKVESSFRYKVSIPCRIKLADGTEVSEVLHLPARGETNVAISGKWISFSANSPEVIPERYIFNNSVEIFKRIQKDEGEAEKSEIVSLVKSFETVLTYANQKSLKKIAVAEYKNPYWKTPYEFLRWKKRTYGFKAVRIQIDRITKYREEWFAEAVVIIGKKFERMFFFRFVKTPTGMKISGITEIGVD